MSLVLRNVKKNSNLQLAQHRGLSENHQWQRHRIAASDVFPTGRLAGAMISSFRNLTNLLGIL